MIEIRYLRISKAPEKQIPNVVYWSFKKKTPVYGKTNIRFFLFQGTSSRRGLKKQRASRNWDADNRLSHLGAGSEGIYFDDFTLHVAGMSNRVIGILNPIQKQPAINPESLILYNCLPNFNVFLLIPMGNRS